MQKNIDSVRASHIIPALNLTPADLSRTRAGGDHWTGETTQCANPANRLSGETEAQCIDRKRIDVARAFFYAPEFLQQSRAANLPNPFPPPDFNWVYFRVKSSS